MLLALLAILATVAVLSSAFVASMFIRTWTYTPLDGETGGRDLIVREWSFLLAGGGELLERDGIWLTRVGVIRFDDGTMPFAHGEYEVSSDHGEVTIDWMFDSGVGPLSLTLSRGTSPSRDGCVGAPQS